MSAQHIILKCSPLRFYSPLDEEALFEWLNKISVIITIEGVGRELLVSIDASTMSYEQLRNLKGVFKRYNFDLEQLKIFMNEGNKNIFT